MREEIRPMICILVLVIMTGAIFLAGWPQVSSGQSDFATYQVDVHCLPRAPAVSFTVQGSGMMGTMWRCAGACDGKIVTLDEVLSEFPSTVSAALRAKVDQHQQNAPPGKRLTCLGSGKEPPESKCEPPPISPGPPWLNPDVPCPERTRGVVSWKYPLRSKDISYTVKICGDVINFVIAGAARGMRSAGARSFDVCCDSWRNAVATGSPCDPRRDIDCDGAINEGDLFPDIPEHVEHGTDFYVYKGQPNRTINEGRFFDSLHPPDQSECENCKWELVSYESTCQNVPNLIASRGTGSQIFDGKHRVKATWRCPVSGTTKVNEETVVLQFIGCPPKPAVPGFSP